MGQSLDGCCTAPNQEKPKPIREEKAHAHSSSKHKEPLSEDIRKELREKVLEDIRKGLDKGKDEKQHVDSAMQPKEKHKYEQSGIFNTAPAALNPLPWKALPIPTPMDQPPEVKALNRKIHQRNEKINVLNREAVWRNRLIEVLESENFEKTEALERLKGDVDQSQGTGLGDQELLEAKAMLQRKEEEVHSLQQHLSSTDETLRAILMETRAKGDAAETLVKALSRQAHLGTEAQNQLRHVDGPPAASPSGFEDDADNELENRNAWADLVEWATSTDVGASAPVPLFERFRKAEALTEIYNCFARLFVMSGGWGHTPTYNSLSVPWYPEGRNRYPYEAICSYLPGHSKAKQLLEILDYKARRSEYTSQPCRSGKLAGKTIMVIGAGPVGLRTAIELRLLGANVTVLEKTSAFDRSNRLQLWNWVFEDLKELGALCLEPPSGNFGEDPDFIHIGINELQVLLLKTALLLGVRVFFGAKYLGSTWNSAESSWIVKLSRTSGAPGPVPPSRCSHIAVVIGADGMNGDARLSFGIDVFSTDRFKDEMLQHTENKVIGVVCNFKNFGFDEEQSLRSFNLSRSLCPEELKQCAQQTGIELENVVYMKSDQTHYFVMTTTVRCLFAKGVIVNDRAKVLLSPSNIDKTELENFARQIAAVSFKKGQKSLESIVGQRLLRFHDIRPALFDFSNLKRATHCAVLLREPQASPLFCLLVGDSLLEPFWPEGLGIMRGFFSALDCASVVSWWSSSELSQSEANDEALKLYAAAYGQLKNFSAKTSDLGQENSRYGLAPNTRYKGIVAPV